MAGKIYNSKDEALKDLPKALKINKTAFAQRVWDGTKHSWRLRVGIDLWFAGEGVAPVKAKLAEDPEKPAAAPTAAPPAAPKQSGGGPKK